MRCMNKSCTINENHGIYFPEKLTTFVQNPTYINGIEKSIQNAKLDFNGKKPFYTTCNYANKKCRNCEEGRIKYIDFNNEKIALCYPSLDAIRYKVTVGLHIDIKLILKGTKYEVSTIPINIIIENKKIQEPVINKKADLNAEENWPSLCTKSTTTPHVKHVLNYSNIEKSNDDSNKKLEENNLIIADIKHVSIKSEPIKEEEKVVNDQIISKDINHNIKK